MDDNQSDILIVDDTPENLYVLNTILSKVGYKVRLVTSAKQALNAMGNRIPDLILLDITMPDIDGYALCRELKSTSNFANIPVIFISALTETVDKVKAFTVGGVDYVTKPFQTEEVLMRIETHLKIASLQAQLTIQNEKLHLLSTMDTLTAIYNRKCLVEYAEKQIEIAKMMVQPLFFAIIDIDYFKKVNFDFGYQYGNTVLSTVSSTISKSISKEQVLGRFGDDQFLVIFPNANINQVQHQLNTINFNISQVEWEKEFKVTLSCGVSEYDNADNFDSLIEKADKKLYLAKKSGRNQIQY